MDTRATDVEMIKASIKTDLPAEVEVIFLLVIIMGSTAGHMAAVATAIKEEANTITTALGGSNHIHYERQRSQTVVPRTQECSGSGEGLHVIMNKQIIADNAIAAVLARIPKLMPQDQQIGRDDSD